MKTVLFKIGGKLLDRSKDLINSISQLTQLYEDHTILKIILIPGGGMTANFVREICLEFSLTDSNAHWLAIYSMNFNGRTLKSKFPHLEYTESLKKLKGKSSCFTIFLPYNFLRKEDILPHSWNVTSDSITLHIAYKLGLSECFLIKDVNGIYDKQENLIKLIPSKELTNLTFYNNIGNKGKSSQKLKNISTPIDNYLPKLIQKYNVSCTILNGKSEKLCIYNYFTLSPKTNIEYTKIIP